jgi:hypothetical protein
MARTRLLVILSIAGAAAFAGCAGTDLATGSIAPYEAANSFYPYGYRDTVVAENQHQVTASGSAAASKSRLEKIALRRAAEIGVDKRKKFLKVGTASFGVSCTKKQEMTHKGRTAPPGARSTVVVDVFFADTQVDETYKDTKTALAESMAALESDNTTADPTDVEAIKAQCGV